MDKFELKEKLIEITDTLNKLGGELFTKGTSDEEAAEIRSIVFTALSKANDTIVSQIYNIY